MQDPRGNLTLTYLGLADKLKPKWIVYENVPGLLSSNGGRDFGSFLGALVELGYGFAYRVLDAQYFGVPQRRRRVFVVACLGDWRAAAEVLSLREGLSGYLAQGGKKRKGTAADAGAGVEAGGLPRTVGTICADTHPGAYTGQDAYTGRLIPSINPVANVQPYTASSFAQYAEGVGTVRASGGDLGGGSETLLAQPRSHWEGGDVHPTLNQSAKGSGGVGSSNQELFSQGGAYLVPGQPIPFRKAKRAQSTTDDETWVEGEVSNTLNNFDLGDTRTTHAVVETIAFTQNQRDEIRELGDKAGALLSSTGTHQTNYIAQHMMPGSVAPTVTSSGPPYSRTGNERVEAEALAVTYDMKQHHNPQPSQTVQLTTMNCSFVRGDTPLVQPAMAVRRLTPVECERLQGFPDNWSRISWKGKPEAECPDGPRYKACGNSMAVPCMFWIGSRIAAVDSNPSPTHA
jgi:DNA (cytosine-5)-methyltransferase 1